MELTEQMIEQLKAQTYLKQKIMMTLWVKTELLKNSLLIA